MLTAVADAEDRSRTRSSRALPRDLGVTFTLVATGQSSGWTAQTIFTDGPKVGTVVIGSSSPAQVCAGSSASFSVTVNRGTGPGSSGSFNAALSVQAAFPPASLPRSVRPRCRSRRPGLADGDPDADHHRSGAHRLLSSFHRAGSNSAMDFADGSGTLNADTEAPSVSAPATKVIEVGPS
jgi:hypothetical protein